MRGDAVKGPFTDLERGVLADIIAKRDPWRGNRGVGSRRVSQAIGRLVRKGLAFYFGVPEASRTGAAALDAYLSPLREATRNRIAADQLAGIYRHGAGEPHAWFCYLGVALNKRVACCARCGCVQSRDSSRWDLPCIGAVTIELRGSAVSQ